MQKLSRSCLLWFWYVCVSALVLAAVLLSAARLLLPLADGYREDVAAWVTNVIGQPVTIESLNASWQGLGPQLVLVDVAILSEDRSRPILTFSKAKIGVDFWSSISHLRLVPGHLIVSGASLNVTRKEDGGFNIGDLSTLNQNAEKSTQSNSLLSDWLFRQSVLEIQDSDVRWVDEKRNIPARFFRHVNIRIQNQSEQHQISGSVLLPEELGEEIRFAADIIGDVVSDNDWSGKGYIAADNVFVERLLIHNQALGAELKSATSNSRVWVEWEQSKLQSVKALVDVSDVVIRSQRGARILRLDKLTSRMAAVRHDDTWRIKAEELNVRSSRGAWPTSVLELEYNLPTKHVAGRASYFDLELISQMLLSTNVLSDNAYQNLQGADPKGQLRQVEFSYDEAADTKFWMRGVIRGGELSAHKRIPGVANLVADFEITEKSGSVSSRSERFKLDYPWLFANKYVFTESDIDIRWRGDVDQTTLYVNRAHLVNTDVNLSAKGRVIIPKNGQKPFWDLIAQANQGAPVTTVKRYLPVGIIPDGVNQWLEKSLKAGYVDKAKFAIYGRVDQFPFEQGQGKFLLRLGVTNGQLAFADHWPEIDKIEGQFEYRGYDLSFNSKFARSKNNALRDFSVRLHDLRDDTRYLRITGYSVGPTKNKLAYLYDSPLNDLFASALKPMVFDGDSRLNLDLRVPLAEGEKVAVLGDLKFSNNHLLAKEWDLDITDLSGKLSFTESEVETEMLTGKLGDVIPLAVGIKTETEANIPILDIRHQGKVNDEAVRYLLTHYFKQLRWASYLEGEALAQVNVRVPLRDSELPISLTAESDLRGMLIRLPQPLYKPEQETASTRVNMVLTGDKRPLSFQYGDLNGVFEFSASAKEITVERGAVGYQEKVSLPDEYGFRYRGVIPRFSWREWEPLFFSRDNQPALIESSGKAAPQFFDLRIQELGLFGAEFKNVDVQASNSSQGWTVHVDSENIAGSVFVPLVKKSGALIANLSRVVINTEGESQQITRLDPRDFPAMKVNARRFDLNGVSFGRLSMNASRQTNGLQLDKLQMVSDSAEINATGQWLVGQGQQSSKFAINVASPNLGKAMTDWGYAGSIRDGDAKLNIDAFWPGAPTDFAFESLTGKLNLSVKDGSLLEVSPGAARLFGLLSLQALPRRLFLDFSDVFAKGMRFDSISGDFKLEGGNAFTSGLLLDGPAAVIDMAGRIGLAAQDYDQVVTVVPKLGASIPLLGALAVTPQIGATLFVVQKLLQKQIDDLSALQYTVTGGWNDPLIQKISKPAAEPSEDLLE